MLKSMTAFGRARAKNANGTKDITAEIKSVNNRYIDWTVRLPRGYSFLEERIKAHVIDRGVSRGKIEITVNIQNLMQTGVAVSLDGEYAKSYISALFALRDEFSLTDDISVMKVAANTDVFTVSQAEENLEREWEDVKTVLDSALDMFIRAREAEGHNLETDIMKKVEGIKEITAKIADISDRNITGYKDKLEERIKKYLSDFNIDIAEQRILTETAIFADKAAIDEELVRLDSHFKVMKEIVSTPEPAGRKLDFLIQEMNRETNTIGSKSADADIAHLVVDIKAELEKIREQIQNVE